MLYPVQFYINYLIQTRSERKHWEGKKNKKHFSPCALLPGAQSYLFLLLRVSFTMMFKLENRSRSFFLCCGMSAPNQTFFQPPQTKMSEVRSKSVSNIREAYIHAESRPSRIITDNGRFPQVHLAAVGLLPLTDVHRLLLTSAVRFACGQWLLSLLTSPGEPFLNLALHLLSLRKEVSNSRPN